MEIFFEIVFVFFFFIKTLYIVMCNALENEKKKNYKDKAIAAAV